MHLCAGFMDMKWQACIHVLYCLSVQNDLRILFDMVSYDIARVKSRLINYCYATTNLSDRPTCNIYESHIHTSLIVLWVPVQKLNI